MKRLFLIRHIRALIVAAKLRRYYAHPKPGQPHDPQGDYAVLKAIWKGER